MSIIKEEGKRFDTDIYPVEGHAIFSARFVPFYDLFFSRETAAIDGVGGNNMLLREK